jgi:archaetidylinositol phosphate synthase
MLSSVKPKLSKTINSLAKPFANINPNILTLLGLVPPIFFLIFLMNGNHLFALLMFFGIFLDTIDGAVARMTGKVTAFGSFLDSSIDRISDALFICGFAFAGIVRYEIVIVVLFLSFFISYLRARAELASNGKISLAVGIIERTERLILLFLSLLLYILLPKDFNFFGFNIAEIIFLLLSILSFITVLQRVFVASKKLKSI